MVETATNAVIERAAAAAHEVNRMYCLMLGDSSQVVWERAPSWQRDSAIKGVCAIVADPLLIPEDLHKGWMAQKQKDGWVYGPEKNELEKTHPCMVPYEQLPPNQRAKDTIFGAVVRGMLGI